MPDTFTCSICRGTFEKAWSDDEAKAEAAVNYPTTPFEDCGIVCDNCYHELPEWMRSAHR